MALLTVFSTAYSSFSLLNSVSNGTQSQTLIIVLLLLAAILCAIIGIAFPFLFIIAGILLVATLIVGIINLQNKREQEIAKKENTEIRKIHPLAQAGAILTTVGLAFFILGFASTLFALLGVAMLIIGAVLGIIALVRIKKDSKKYKGTAWAIFALTPFGILLLLFIAFLLLLPYIHMGY